MVDTVNNLTINDAKYYESDTDTASDAQDDITKNMETFTHPINSNETVNHTSKTIFGQKLFSNYIIPVFSPVMNLGIEQGIEPIILAQQTLMTPVTKEVVANTALGGAWLNRTPRQVSSTGIDGITPGDIRDAVSVVEPPSPVLVVIVDTSPPFGLNVSQQVPNKRQSASPGLVEKPQKWTLLLTESCPMISIRRPFSAR